MDNSHYASIDAGSVNWSPVHALSLMIYQEAFIASRHDGNTAVLNMQLLNNVDIDDLPDTAQRSLESMQEFFQRNTPDGVVNHIDASTLKEELSPHLFALYQSLAQMPQDTEEQIEATRQVLTNFLGTAEKAEAFMATSREHSAEIQAIAEATPRAEADAPQESLELGHASCFNSPALTAQLFSIFCQDNQLPHIFKDGTLFDCFENNINYQKRYALRQSPDGKFKLLANRGEQAVAESFDEAFFNREALGEEAVRYSTQPAPRGLSYYFGSMPATTRTLLGLGSVISMIVGLLYLIKRFTKGNTDTKASSSATATLNQKSDNAPQRPQQGRKEPLLLSRVAPARVRSQKTTVRTVRTSDKRWGRRRR